MDESNLSDIELLTPDAEETSEVAAPEVPEVANQDNDEDEKEKPEADEDETRSVAPIHSRPTIGEIKAEFPELFKKFPALKDVYFREQRYSAMFPTVEAAEEAQDNSLALTSLRDDILAGDSKNLLTAIKDTDPEALDKVAAQLLPNLYRLSPEAHWKATLPLMENLTRQFYNEGAKRGDESVMNAALHLAMHLFGDADIAKGGKTLQQIPDKGVSDDRKRLEAERKSFQDERSGSFTINVQSKAFDGITQLVGDDKKLDPEGVLSTFVKKTIKQEIINDVNSQMAADPSHMAYINSLWKQAKESNFVGDWEARITSAYLARAKSLIPALRVKYISEAMGTSQAQSGNKSAMIDKITGRREAGSSGKVPNQGNGVYSPKDVDWSKTSDEDMLNGRVTLKVRK